MNPEETEISSASEPGEKMEISTEDKATGETEVNEEIPEKPKDAEEVLDTSSEVNPGVSFSQSEESKDDKDILDVKNDDKNQEIISEIAIDKNLIDTDEKPIEAAEENKESSEQNPLEVNDDNKTSDVINSDDLKEDEAQPEEEMKEEEDAEKPEIEAVELPGEPEKMNLDVLESSSNEIEEINPIDTSETSIATDQLEEDIEEQNKEQDSLFVNDSTDIIEENSKEQDDYDDFNKSKCLDENSIDKDEDPANNIEYVDFQDNLDDTLDKDNLAEKDSDERNADGSMEVDENPLLIKDYKDESDKDALNKDVLLDEDQDPIASDGFHLENEEGADEELCIIPDTERVISEAEKEAAISIPPLKDITEASTSTDNAEDSASIIEVPDDSSTTDKYIIKKYGAEDIQSCSQCILQRKAKYVMTKNDKTEYICTDACLDNFKAANEDNYVLNLEGEIRVKNFTASSKQIPKLNFERKCVVCTKKTDDEENNLTWEIMDFCNEYCLAKYQKEIGSVCASCNSEVRANSLGKYCVRFGNDIRQFCSSHCLEEYKKGLKVCSYCQQDMSIESDGFLAPVGDKGQFKDFCSQVCMEKYDIMTNNRPPKVEEGTKCSVCKLEKPITTEYKVDEVNNYFCGDPCLVAFSFVNNITPAKCSMCRRYFSNEILEKNTMFYDNVQYGFCSNSCQNIYIIAHRKIVPCAWCKVKKYNFDMIRRYFKSGPVLNMCSINCLSFFQVSVNAVHSKKTVCNFCNKRHQPMYHLTMSDATIRNFCSYSCVMSFQNKFKKSPITLNEAENPVPTGEPKKNKKFAMQTETPSSKAVSPPPLPVITNVQSLAKGETTTTSRTTRAKTNAASQHILNANVEVPVKIKHHIIIKPQVAKEQRNVSTMCKVKTLHKGSNAKPASVDKECQTEQREAEKILIPIPIPVYIPSPLPMYSVPAPFPLPFPIPIPVPIFIPTTRNSAKGIMKEIKKIQVKIPTDPYEAELLMMAEMVAGDKKTEENTDSESDVDDTAGGDDGSFSPEPVDASNTFGDDMLQMALKMATEELEEPAVDLEGALTANTITAPQGSEPSNEEAVDDPQPILNMGDRPVTYRGRKRGRGNKQNSSTKRRRVVPPVDMQPIASQPVPPPEPTEKPDAHLCLKYTFGVNAWKQWVTTKNGELEKQTKYVKPFKTEILQLTADELNFSLCLFVKEVRKPNGAEYAPDTIYYLCLGIQQYLFENNRIDNIFCDPYYEQFTDSLDEVARKFSVLYNDSHYIVTRVEEEHLWESKQLGAHSPHVLLSTLMFFNTKHFNLTSVQEHMQLSFSHIMKHWKRNPNQPGVARTPGSRNVLLRFYPPQSAIQNNTRKKKVYEQQENDDNPLRCPVKLYEFYLSKCPESVKTRNDVFYLQPERSCVPDSPVWYSTSALAQEALEKMLHRVKMVKEINVALLTS